MRNADSSGTVKTFLPMITESINPVPLDLTEQKDTDRTDQASVPSHCESYESLNQSTCHESDQEPRSDARYSFSSCHTITERHGIKFEQSMSCSMPSQSSKCLNEETRRHKKSDSAICEPYSEMAFNLPFDQPTYAALSELTRDYESIYMHTKFQTDNQSLMKDTMQCTSLAVPHTK